MATVPRLQRYYQSATTSYPRMSFGLLISPAGSAGACRGSCPPWGRSRRRAGPATGRGLDCSRWQSPSSLFAHGQEQDLPGSLAIHPVTLRRSTTPDDPLRLTNSGASGTAHTHLTMKASSFVISRLRDASSPAVYASRRALPHAMQDSLPAGGLRLCRAGVEPAEIATRGFRSSHPPLQGFAWRNKCSFRRKDSVVPGWRHQGRRNFPVLLERRSLDAVLSSTSSRPDRMITFRRNHSVVPGWAWSS